MDINGPKQTKSKTLIQILFELHLLVVQPVPTDGPPVVAEVILNGWVCHL